MNNGNHFHFTTTTENTWLLHTCRVKFKKKTAYLKKKQTKPVKTKY